MNDAEERMEAVHETFEHLTKQSKDAKLSFERIKQQRYELFTKCTDHVFNEIDDIYKTLVQNDSAQAFLEVEEQDEPYLHGIKYDCVAPGKRYQPMSNLSGGEKTMAALALLFAIHSYQPSPFFVLDEIDAPLDLTNIENVAKYIRTKTECLQMIIISLKREFYSHTDLLLGIYPGVRKINKISVSGII